MLQRANSISDGMAFRYIVKPDCGAANLLSSATPPRLASSYDQLLS